jgi:hypothetical protein
MRIVEYVCDICGEKAQDVRVVEVKWVNSRDPHEYHLCESCKHTLHDSEREDQLHGENPSRVIFKALLKLFYKRAKSKE